MDETFARRRIRAASPRLAAPASLLLILACAGAGCSNYIGTTAASFLRRVQDDPDPNVRYLAYAKLASPGCYDSAEQKQEAVRVLVEKLKKGREPVASRAVICHTLGELRDKSAREVILKMTSDPEPIVRVEACRALGKVGNPEDATVLARVMTVDTLEDCRIAAIDALGELKAPDPRINRVLLVGLRSDDPAMRYASLNALRNIAGTDAGVTPEAWEKVLETKGPETIAGGGPPPPLEPSPAVAASAPAYPPRLTPLPDPPIDGSTQPAGYPPAPRPYNRPR